MVLERGHDRAQKKTPTTTLVELKETIESSQSMDEEEVKQVVRGIRRRARACLERNGAAFEGRQQWAW